MPYRSGRYNPRHRHPCRLPSPFTQEEIVLLPPGHPDFLRRPPLFTTPNWEPTTSPPEHPLPTKTEHSWGTVTSRETRTTRRSTSNRIRIFVTPPISPRHTRKPQHYATPKGSLYRLRRLLNPRF